MQHSLIIRLVDITLLLLLSLMAIASIDPYSAEPPISEAIEDQGVIFEPLLVSISAEGVIEAYDAEGNSLTITPDDLAAIVSGNVEVVADRRAPAHLLLTLHQSLQSRGIRTAFLVTRIAQSP